MDLTRTERDMDSPDPPQHEDKYIRLSSLRNRCLTGAQLEASLNKPNTCDVKSRLWDDAGLYTEFQREARSDIGKEETQGWNGQKNMQMVDYY